MKYIDSVFADDSRVEKVYKYAKEKYQEAGLVQHNWEHIIGNLYRGLVIADAESFNGKDIDYSILTVSILFHDIGCTEGGYENHEERSIEIAERELPKYDFSEDEIKQITHAIDTVGELADSKTIEAKICSDADKLVKSGFASVFNFFRVQKELDRPLEEFASSTSRYEQLQEIGFYTEKATEMSDGGFQERIEFMEKFHNKLKERPDFTVTEKELFSM